MEKLPFLLLKYYKTLDLKPHTCPVLDIAHSGVYTGGIWDERENPYFEACGVEKGASIYQDGGVKRRNISGRWLFFSFLFSKGQFESAQTFGLFK